MINQWKIEKKIFTKKKVEHEVRGDPYEFFFHFFKETYTMFFSKFVLTVLKVKEFSRQILHANLLAVVDKRSAA